MRRGSVVGSHGQDISIQILKAARGHAHPVTGDLGPDELGHGVGKLISHMFRRVTRFNRSGFLPDGARELGGTAEDESGQFPRVQPLAELQREVQPGRCFENQDEDDCAGRAGPAEGGGEQNGRTYGRNGLVTLP
jgi:hypothetical protein